MREPDRQLLKVIEQDLCSLERVLEYDTLEDAWNDSDNPNGMCWVVRLVFGQAQDDKLRCEIRAVFDVEIRYVDRLRAPNICDFIRSRFPARTMIAELAYQANLKGDHHEAVSETGSPGSEGSSLGERHTTTENAAGGTP